LLLSHFYNPTNMKRKITLALAVISMGYAPASAQYTATDKQQA
jgi:hypothetical protein